MSKLDRALPGPMIDLIRDGVPPADLGARGSRAVWSALCRTAASAVQRGWSRSEWEALVLEQSSQLGRQLGIRKGRDRSAAAVANELRNAWDSAVKWVAERPGPHDPAQLAADASSRAAAAFAVAADLDADLTPSERAVLSYLAEETRRRGLTKVPAPWRAVQNRTGLREGETKRALRDLVDRGRVELVDRGRASSDVGRRKASMYRLPAALPQPIPVPRKRGLWEGAAAEVRSMGGEPRGAEPVWEDGQVYGRPSPSNVVRLFADSSPGEAPPRARNEAQ